MTPEEKALKALEQFRQRAKTRGPLGIPPESLGEVHPEWTSDNGYNGIPIEDNPKP